MRLTVDERTSMEADRVAVKQNQSPNSILASTPRLKTPLKNWISLLAVSISLCACSTVEHRGDGSTGTLTRSQEQAILKDSQTPTTDLNDSGSDLNAIPLEVNRMVLSWIDYFQGRGRPHMERYLSRLTRYSPVMKDILRKEGLPEDLIYIALIESGFSSTAHSSAAAVGYWQFIRGTGKHYNLQIDSFVDERRDFIRSTQAAAEYFKGLYNLFGAWYLAIASYNVGENRVKNLVMKYHTRDFWQLARENKLPDETINYVPKFLAARLIAKEPEKYGFTDIEYMPALEFSEVEFATSIDLRKLATAMNLEYDDIRDLNPSYKRGVAFDKGGKLTLRVPKGQESVALAAASSAAAESRKVYVASEDWSYYRVRRGETIATIAKKFGTSQSELRQLNRLKASTRLAAGRRIRVPAETVGGLARQESSRPKMEQVSDKSDKKARQVTRLAASKKNGREPQTLSRKVHIVRKGDTLMDIARKYRVSIRDLASHNSIGRRAKIPVGAKLEIP